MMYWQMGNGFKDHKELGLSSDMNKCLRGCLGRKPLIIIRLLPSSPILYTIDVYEPHALHRDAHHTIRSCHLCALLPSHNPPFANLSLD